MKTKERRKKILEILTAETDPVKGTELAEQMGVTRQVIINDMNVLRAGGISILSSPSGYRIEKKESVPDGSIHLLFCPGCTYGKEDVLEEMNIIVDNGGCIQKLRAESPNFGTVTVALPLRSRRDVRLYLDKVYDDKGAGISRMLRRVHTLQVKTHNDAEWEDIVREMKKKRDLYKEEDNLQEQAE